MLRAGSCTLGLQADRKPTFCSACRLKLSLLIIYKNSRKRPVEQLNSGQASDKSSNPSEHDVIEKTGGLAAGRGAFWCQEQELK